MGARNRAAHSDLRVRQFSFLINVDGVRNVVRLSSYDIDPAQETG